MECKRPPEGNDDYANQAVYIDRLHIPGEDLYHCTHALLRFYPQPLLSAVQFPPQGLQRLGMLRRSCRRLLCPRSRDVGAPARDARVSAGSPKRWPNSGEAFGLPSPDACLTAAHHPSPICRTNPHRTPRLARSAWPSGSPAIRQTFAHSGGTARVILAGVRHLTSRRRQDRSPPGIKAARREGPGPAGPGTCADRPGVSR
jgi:hypothetical protein